MPENNASTVGASLRKLHDSLKSLHPADLRSVTKALIAFMSEEMAIPKPVYQSVELYPEYPAIIETGKEILAYTEDTPAGFSRDLAAFARLLGAVHEWVSMPWLSDVRDFFPAELLTGDVTSNMLRDITNELDRIGVNLGLDSYGYESHRGIEETMCIDPLEKYLHETQPNELLRRKAEILVSDFEREWSAIGEPHQVQNEGPQDKAFSRCARFDAHLAALQARAEAGLRSIGARVAQMARTCAGKISASQSAAAGAFSQQLEAAAEAIKAK